MIISVSHQKGGVGKSTIAWNLAIGLLNQNIKVELIDIDIQQTLFYTNEIRKENNSLKPITVKSIKDLTELKKLIQTDDENKISVIDIGGFDSEMGRTVIATSDIIVTPVSDKNFELLGIKTFEKTLKEIGEALNKTIVVNVLLNNINANKTNLNDLLSFLEKSPNFNLMKTIIRQRVDFNSSVGEGKNVIEFSEKSKASKEIKSLIKEVLSI